MINIVRSFSIYSYFLPSLTRKHIFIFKTDLLNFYLKILLKLKRSQFGIFKSEKYCLDFLQKSLSLNTTLRGKYLVEFLEI
jgi:hypothetical protein